MSFSDGDLISKILLTIKLQCCFFLMRYVQLTPPVTLRKCGNPGEIGAMIVAMVLHAKYMP